MGDEEPLEDWARRREERRNALKGKLRVVALTEGPHRGAHLEPDQSHHEEAFRLHAMRRYSNM
ncbi:DUF6087 family protein [Streptomyces sp. NPDC093589]|uniref:DUF6087 family protein n=1 Tax=Streptomyces sp. NPDC093589 TaxID=3366043 RepID=UPI003819F67B